MPSGTRASSRPLAASSTTKHLAMCGHFGFDDAV